MNKIKLICVLCFFAFGIAVLFTDNALIPAALSRSTGPQTGRTGAPSETTCTGCHAVNAGPGVFSVTAPANYVPGQTYQIQVQHSTTDTTRLRWGFELTSLDGLNLAAGTFADTSAFTQIKTGTIGGNARLYPEHTSAGTFAGTSGGASWSFNWIAPATDVGPVTFYAAGLQADNDGTNAGDQTYTATTVAAPTVAVSGTVTYGNAIGSPNPRFVSNVLLSGEGSPSVSTTTYFPGGNYGLAGFGEGSYTVTPTKTDGQNGITSFDAAKVAQHAAGVILLTGNQLIVADTSDNGDVTSFDAATLASYVIHRPPYGVTGNWKFLPANRIYASVSSSISAEDYTALLMGDVTGNWTNTSARPTRSGGPERAVAVNLPSVITQAAKEMIVPVNVQGVANKRVISYEFELRYDPTVIQPLAEPVDVKGTASRGLSAVTNAEEPGVLRVALFGAMSIDNNGVLLNLRFMAVGASGSVSPLIWERLMFNEGEPRVSTVDGKVELF